jgi:hypothetical protein
MDHAGMEQDRLELEWYRTGKKPYKLTKAYQAKQEFERQKARAMAKRAGVVEGDSIVQEAMKILKYTMNGGK